MLKIPKINVLAITLKVDIPVDPSSIKSVQDAAGQAERLRELGNLVGRATMETRLNRVAAPQPKFGPADDTVDAG